MKLLKHLATFGGLYLAAGFLYWGIMFDFFPMIGVAAGFGYWDSVLLSHCAMAFLAWFFYGAIKS